MPITHSNALHRDVLIYALLLSASEPSRYKEIMKSGYVMMFFHSHEVVDSCLKLLLVSVKCWYIGKFEGRF